MLSIPLLTAAETCQTTSTANVIVGWVFIGGFIAAIVALGVANSRARSRLQIANAELSFLRPENARLQQWLTAMGGAPGHRGVRFRGIPVERAPTTLGPGPVRPPPAPLLGRREMERPGGGQRDHVFRSAGRLGPDVPGTWQPVVPWGLAPP